MKACLKCDHVNPDEISFCEECGIMLPVGDNESDPFPGTLLVNKFRIQELIGQGAMGRVYSATQEPINRKVAVKILHQHLMEDRRVARRFQREAEAASRFSHPNSIGIFDFGQTKEGSLYIAMEYIIGHDLADVISRQAPLQPERAVRIATQTLSALHLAHASQIIHRDLKPENIMLSELPGHKDFVKVCDFGIAKIQQQPGTGQESALTMFGMICGTPYYMSPEQAKGEDLDGRTDLYSMGVILYEMLTGEVPFRGSTPVEVIARHLTDPPLPPSKLRPELRIPRALEDVVLRSLSKSRNERFADAQEFADALEKALKEAEFQADLERVLQQAQGEIANPTHTPVNQLNASFIPHTVMDGANAFQLAPPGPGTPRATPVVMTNPVGPPIASPRAPLAMRSSGPLPYANAQANRSSQPMPAPIGRHTPVPSMSPTRPQQNPPLLLTDSVDDLDAQPKSKSGAKLFLIVVLLGIGVGVFFWHRSRTAIPPEAPAIRGYAIGMEPGARQKSPSPIPTPTKKAAAPQVRPQPRRSRSKHRRRRRVARLSHHEREMKKRFLRVRSRFVDWKKSYRFYFADLGSRIERLFNDANRNAKAGNYQQAHSIITDMIAQIEGYNSVPTGAIKKKYDRLNAKFTRIRKKMRPDESNQVEALFNKALEAFMSTNWPETKRSNTTNGFCNRASKIIDRYK